MGIRVRNLETVVLHLRSAGTLTAANNKDVTTVPFDGFISNVLATVTSGGTGSTASIVDIHYLGTTIFAAATKITLASTTGVATYSAVSTLSVTAGAYFTMDIDSIALAPANLEVLIAISKGNPGTEQNAANHNLIL